MSVRFQRSVHSLLGLLVAACAPNPPPEQVRTDEDVVRRDGAIIISGQALEDGRGSILSAMQGKVPGLRIQRYARDCPQISLRSHASFQSVINPHVYVDGTRATDTCILESLRAEDVASVEVYPMGVTKRPGYGTHAHGLILVFMRTQ